jgi:DNA-binding NarL/FixJ family response regulator
VRRLLVTVHSDDPRLHAELLRGLPANGVVCELTLADVSAHGHQATAPDLVFVDAGPPPATSLPGELRKAYPAAFVVLVAQEVDEATLRLGASVGADAYIRRDESPADAVTAMLAVAALTRRRRQA